MCERRGEPDLTISKNTFVLGCMSTTPTFFLIVASKCFVPRGSGIEEAEWVLGGVLFGKNLVVADDFCQWERL